MVTCCYTTRIVGVNYMDSTYCRSGNYVDENTRNEIHKYDNVHGDVPGDIAFSRDISGYVEWNTAMVCILVNIGFGFEHRVMFK